MTATAINNNLSERDLQEKCAEFVEREVLVCLSALVNEFMRKDSCEFIDNYPELVGGYIENEDGEEDYIEIYEYWSVSDWLAEKLQDKGERVECDFHGLCVWGRTTTGQAISMDCVIRELVQEALS